ncbi:Rossmann-like and DUF2520 domain-containing protein [Garciella nitratireducens]|uniref:Rossmann-like and DUF2520 domain-containing protein n=1 Tax=Garciella nitratireducens TaxID=218205 RepID=UPI000DE940C9|nr:Rossmann-like and DUF2520 domain-containing protein [Garciella nitratireducens]RBP42732.1 putative short-subunit dehydrogenase-like oxidoreductase (DUF2520 family) [Garciella nitratireducens]
MNIGFIGAGKVGCSFGHYLKQQNLSIIGYYSRSTASSSYAAHLTHSSPLEFAELIKKSDYIFITTPDCEISNIWNRMLEYPLAGKRIFHMSGCLSSNIFCGWKEKQVLCYSIHPLFSFADKNSSHLEDVVFSIEGNYIEKIKNFLEKSHLQYFIIEEKNKPLYHASAVFVSNYMVTLAKIAEDLLKKCGLNQFQCVNAIYPLMKSTLENIKEKQIVNSLTGPIIRGDEETVKRHIENLNQYKKYRDIYRSLGEIALEIAEEKKNLSEEKTNQLYKILRGDCNEKNCVNI